MSEEYLRRGQERGTWTAGLFLATFGLVGAVLMLGLVLRWGEGFPCWMIGLAGRRVPIALAVVPASLISVLLIVAASRYDEYCSTLHQDPANDGPRSMPEIGRLPILILPPGSKPAK